MADVSLDDFGVDDQSLCDVLQSAEDDVSCQEGLGQGDPPGMSEWRGVSKYGEEKRKQEKEAFA